MTSRGRSPFRRTTYAAVLIAALLIASPAAAQELLTNGNFELGNFTGWTVTDAVGGSGSWFISSPGATAPFSGNATAANPSGGSFYAVVDQGGPGAHALIQTFTVPSEGRVTLTFQMFVNNWTDPIVDPSRFDFGGNPLQYSRVDILANGAGPFSTTSGVLATLFVGGTFTNTPTPYLNYTFDITKFVGGGGTFQLRFGEVDNQYYLNQGVDNVSVQFVAAPGVPTMTTWGIISLASLLLAAAAWTLSRRNRMQTI